MTPLFWREKSSLKGRWRLETVQDMRSSSSNPVSCAETPIKIYGSKEEIRARKSPETVDAPGFAPDASIPVTLYGADGRIRTCDFPSSRFTLRSDPLPRLRYICIEGGARLSELPANHVMAHRRFYVSRVLSVPEHTCSKENLKASLLGTSPCVRNYNIEA